MSSGPSATAFFSKAAYEEALVDRRLHEISAFREIAEYATRGHVLSLPMVREEYLKSAGKGFERGEDYWAAILAADVYEFLGVFASARTRGIAYEGALREALQAPGAIMTNSLFVYEGSLADSVRHCKDHLQDRRHESHKACVTQDALIETLYALRFLHMHLDQHEAIRDGSLLGIQKIQWDINDALNAGTGLENAARAANTSPEVLYIATIQIWLQQQAAQSLLTERNMFERIQQGCAMDAKTRVMLEAGAFYRDICVCLHSALTEAVKTGIYLAYFDTAARKAGKDETVDPAIALHCCMQDVLQAQIEVLQSGQGEHCGPGDAPVFAAAYTALMHAVDKQFPLRTTTAPQGAPSGPAPL